MLLMTLTEHAAVPIEKVPSCKRPAPFRQSWNDVWKQYNSIISEKLYFDEKVLILVDGMRSIAL